MPTLGCSGIRNLFHMTRIPHYSNEYGGYYILSKYNNITKFLFLLSCKFAPSTMGKRKKMQNLTMQENISYMLFTASW